jgi:hypothetical protein
LARGWWQPTSKCCERNAARQHRLSGHRRRVNRKNGE